MENNLRKQYEKQTIINDFLGNLDSDDLIGIWNEYNDLKKKEFHLYSMSELYEVEPIENFGSYEEIVDYFRDFDFESDYFYYDFRGIHSFDSADEILDFNNETDFISFLINECENATVKDYLENRFESDVLKAGFNPLHELRSCFLSTKEGLYGIEYRNGRLYSGGITNTGIFYDFEIDYDFDLSVEENVQRLVEAMQEENPDLF